MSGIIFNNKIAPNAKNVSIAGSFNNWTPVPMIENSPNNYSFNLKPESDTKVFYKLVIDGQWMCDESAPKEKDEKGIFNNCFTFLAEKKK